METARYFETLETHPTPAKCRNPRTWRTAKNNHHEK